MLCIEHGAGDPASGLAAEYNRQRDIIHSSAIPPSIQDREAEVRKPLGVNQCDHVYTKMTHLS